MKKVCGWCKKTLFSEKESITQTVTHGICKKCLFHFRAQEGMSFLDYLNGLEVPIAVIDSDSRVQSATKSLENILGKTDPQIIGKLGGEVFECEYSYLPEGCGKTIHCNACTIRFAVMETFLNGRSQRSIPVYLNQKGSSRVKSLNLVISTEKVDDVVLLRIENIEEVRKVETSPDL